MDALRRPEKLGPGSSPGQDSWRLQLSDRKGAGVGMCDADVSPSHQNGTLPVSISNHILKSASKL